MSDSKKDQKIQRVLKKIGYVAANKIADTLQGSIWRASQITKSEGEETAAKTVVIKVTDQFLHKHSISIVDGHKYKVNEDILLEQSILKYLTENENCPESLVKFKRFFRTNTDYYLVMEDGGTSLFQFITNAHKLISVGKIDINDWQKVIKVIFKQMMECIDYIHSKNVCHFDVSLENFLINDVQVEVENNGKIRFVTDDIQIKLCDFGLAKLFTSSDCRGSKFCGKQNYKSPECLNKIKKFDAKKNDIWTLGVCLFMMSIGLSPWNEASKNDTCFVYIMSGYIMDVLKQWKVLHFVDDDLVDLFTSIFQYEPERISLAKMKQHPWNN